MSMNLYVYVGPYLECRPKGGVDDVDGLTDGRLMDLCGERSQALDYDVFGPNIAVPGIGRPLQWERCGESSAIVTNPDVRGERMKFDAQLREDIQALGRVYESVLLQWGIVPYWM